MSTTTKEYPPIETELTKMLGMKYPVIMAPMFLVSNAAMTIAAVKSGITGCIPALNYRTDDELRAAIKEIRDNCDGPIGFNLIVNKSNIRYREQLKTLVELEVDYIITSLGNPEETIRQCKAKDIKVFCDVTDVHYAKKVADLGADAVIAVNKEAGGHAGNISGKDLVPLLIKEINIPVISAGGVGNGLQFKERLEWGACGISMGSPFIASTEAGVSKEYKQAVVDYGAKDIVMTTKLSGTPCTVINTPYVQKIGTEQSWLEKLLNKNKKLKKYMKMITFLKGMKSLEKAAFGATYKTLWCAGPSIEYVNEIKDVKDIVKELISSYYNNNNG